MYVEESSADLESNFLQMVRKLNPQSLEQSTEQGAKQSEAQSAVQNEAQSAVQNEAQNAKQSVVQTAPQSVTRTSQSPQAQQSMRLLLPPIKMDVSVPEKSTTSTGGRLRPPPPPPTAPRPSAPLPPLEPPAPSISSQTLSHISPQIPPPLPPRHPLQQTLPQTPPPTQPQAPPTLPIAKKLTAEDRTPQSYITPIEHVAPITKQPQTKAEIKQQTKKRANAKSKTEQTKSKPKISNISDLPPRGPTAEDIAKINNLYQDQGTSKISQSIPHTIYNEIIDRPIYDYRTVILPSNISKKKYSENNQHLPKVFYKKEYSALLFVAVANDDVNTIKALISSGADINAKDARNGYTPLMYAVKIGKLKAMRYLITRGAQINAHAFDGKTAAHLAAMANNIEAIKILISASVNTELRDNSGHKAMYYLQDQVRDQVVLDLVKEYSSMDYALIDCASYNSLIGIQYALNHGADINYKDNRKGANNGDAALIVATKNNDVQIVSYLLMAGANINITNAKGMNVTQIAKDQNDTQILNIILTITAQKTVSMAIK